MARIISQDGDKVLVQDDYGDQHVIDASMAPNAMASLQSIPQASVDASNYSQYLPEQISSPAPSQQELEAIGMQRTREANAMLGPKPFSDDAAESNSRAFLLGKDKTALTIEKAKPELDRKNAPITNYNSYVANIDKQNAAANSINERLQAAGLPASEPIVQAVPFGKYVLSPESAAPSELGSSPAGSSGVGGSVGSSASVGAKPEKSRITQSFDEMGRGYQKQMDAEIGAFKAKEDFQKAKADYYNEEYKKQLEVDAKRDKIVDDHMVRQKDYQDRYLAKEAVNPWERADTGTKITSALAIGLGALGSAITGGPNYALQIINKAIDDDINLQLKSIDKMGNVVAQNREYLKDIKDNFASEDQRKNALRELHTAGAIAKLDSLVANNEQLKTSGEYQVLRGKLQNEKDNYGLDRAKKIAEIAEINAKTEQSGNAKAGNYIPGVGYASSEKDAEAAKNINQSSIAFNKSLAEAMDLRKEFGNEVFNQDAIARGKSLSRDLLLQVKNLGQLGVLSKSDEDIINDIIPKDITKIGFGVEAQLKEAGNFMQKRAEAFYQSRGLKTPNKMLGITPKITKDQGNQIVDWARANPNDPRAKRVLESLK